MPWPKRYWKIGADAAARGGLGVGEDVDLGEAAGDGLLEDDVEAGSRAAIAWREWSCGGVQMSTRSRFTAVFEPLAQAKRLRQATHVGGNPEVALGTIRFQRHCRAPRGNAAFEERTAFFVGRVTAKPVRARARQPGGGFEVLGVFTQPRFPNLSARFALERSVRFA